MIGNDFEKQTVRNTAVHNMYGVYPCLLYTSEAGAVSDYDPLHPEARIICAANPEILNDLLNILNETK